MVRYRVLRLAFAILAAAAGPGPAVACALSGTVPVLSVTGSLPASNRPAQGPLDRFLAHQNQTLGRTLRFTADEIARQPQGRVEMLLPYDGQRHVFTGPTLDGLLAAVGGPSGMLRLSGIDGYAVELAADDVRRLRPILAACLDDQPLAVGDLGPLMLVHVPADTATLRPTDEEFGRMIWGVYLVTVAAP